MSSTKIEDRVVHVSVIVCTRNRAEFLGRTLKEISENIFGEHIGLEVVVVDNGSTDTTVEVLNRWQNGRDDRVVIYENRVGQVFARNVGVASCSGEVVLFTDDDVVVPSTWVEALTRPLLLGEADVVAGPVELAMSLERAWLTPRLKMRLAWTSVSDDRFKRVAGANFGFTKACWERVGGFDEALGPGRLGFCDETLFVERVRQKGGRIRWVSNGACVTHCPGQERLLRSAWISDADKMGRSAAYFDHHFRGKLKQFLLVRYLYNTLHLLLLRLRNTKMLENSEGISEIEWGVRTRKAYNLERWRLKNEVPKYRSST